MRRLRALNLPRNVVLLGAVSLFTDVSSEMIAPLLPLFLTMVLKSPMAFVGLVEGGAESLASLLKYVSGKWSDRIPLRKPLVLFGYGLSTLARPLVALAIAPWHVLAVRLADRTGKGIRTAPRDALIADATEPALWGRSFGFHRAMDHIGAVIGPLLATILLLARPNDLRMVFWIAAVPGVVSFLILWFGVAEKAARPREQSQSPTLGGYGPRFHRYLAIVFLFTLGNSSDAFLVLRAHDLGIAAAWIPILWMVLHVVKGASVFPAGILSDRVGRKRLIVSGWLVYAAVYAGFGLATTPIHIWILFIVYGLFFGLTEGVERALVADLVPESRRGGAFGLYHLAIGIGALPASLMMGTLWDLFGPPAAFALGAVLAVASAVLLSRGV